jgi:hypothetical protein
MQTIEKYKVYFLYDVHEHLKTLQGLNKWAENIDVVVPSHGEIFDFSKEDDGENKKREFLNLIEENKKVIEDVLGLILGILVEPKTIDEILSEVVANFLIPIDATSYVLLLQTLKAYCSYLVNVNEIGLTTEVFKKVERKLKLIWFGTEYVPAEMVIRKMAHFGLYFVY